MERCGLEETSRRRWMSVVRWFGQGASLDHQVPLRPKGSGGSFPVPPPPPLPSLGNTHTTGVRHEITRDAK